MGQFLKLIGISYNIKNVWDWIASELNFNVRALFRLEITFEFGIGQPL